MFLQYAIDSCLLSLFLSSLMSDLPNSCLKIFLDCFLSQPPAWCKNESGSIVPVISTVILLWLIFKILHYMVISIPPFFQICSLYLGKVNLISMPKSKLANTSWKTRLWNIIFLFLSFVSYYFKMTQKNSFS